MLFDGDDYGTIHPLMVCTYFMEGQPVELMQFTGLKDRNGKEIYEGDILFWNTRRKLVSWNNEYLSWFIVDCENNELAALANILNSEVIGNKYENPELLKEK